MANFTSEPGTHNPLLGNNTRVNLHPSINKILKIVHIRWLQGCVRENGTQGTTFSAMASLCIHMHSATHIYKHTFAFRAPHLLYSLIPNLLHINITSSHGKC